MGITPPLPPILAKPQPQRIYKVFISGSNSDEKLKSEVDCHIKILDEYLRRDLNLAIRTWYTPRDARSNYPTYMEDIETELHTSDLFIGIAFRFFRHFTVMEWEIALKMLTGADNNYKFRDGAVFYFGNGETTEIENEGERKALENFVAGLRRINERGKYYWYQYKTFVAGEGKEESNQHIKKVLLRDLYSPLHTWIIKNYDEFRATEPTRGGAVYLGAE